MAASSRTSSRAKRSRASPRRGSRLSIVLWERLSTARTAWRRSPGVVWTTGIDRGMYDAIGRGLALAHGEVLAYQNADDRYVVPGAVSAVMRYLGAHPDVDVVYGDFRYIDEGGRALRRPAPG